MSDLAAMVAGLPPIKVASITLSPRQQFLYCPLLGDNVSKWTALQEKVVPASAMEKPEIDHITVCFCSKADEALPQSKVDEIVKALQEVANDHPSINAKVSGWSYFDGAVKDGETVTALVALVNAPGLPEVQAEMKSVLERRGCKPSSAYSFTPHFTFAYLKHGERVEDLPVLNGEFTIDKLCFANESIHELPLKGSLGAKAASLILKGK